MRGCKDARSSARLQAAAVGAIEYFVKGRRRREPGFRLSLHSRYKFLRVNDGFLERAISIARGKRKSRFSGLLISVRGKAYLPGARTGHHPHLVPFLQASATIVALLDCKHRLSSDMVYLLNGMSLVKEHLRHQVHLPIHISPQSVKVRK